MNNQEEKYIPKPSKYLISFMDLVFFLFLCIYVSVDPYRNGVTLSNIVGYIPTLIVLLLMIVKNMREKEIYKLEMELKEAKETIEKLKPIAEANIRKKTK